MTHYAEVAERVASESYRIGCDRHAVTLVAVSKTHPYSAVLEAYAEGARIFGENRVQEVMEKFPLPAERPEGMRVYLIGHLQSNKVKKIVPLCDRIESVDSLALLLEIEKQAAKCGKSIEVLFEVNTSEEEQKSGFTSPEALSEAIQALSATPHVVMKGFMTVGPLGGDAEKNRKAFSRLAQLQGEYGYPVLSMGMSGDWQDAIASGSSEVRIGTAIFGVRDYGQKSV